MRTILVPTDFSPHSSIALDRAIELAQGLSARIVLLHSYSLSSPAHLADAWTVPTELMEKLRDAGNAELEQWAKRTAQAGIPGEARLSSEPAVSAILNLAVALPADLIVMGTHGHTGWRHAMLGSTAHKVLRLASCPVLTVKEPQP
jgi:nucleotide-binding universal stress UspA family protein